MVDSAPKNPSVKSDDAEMEQIPSSSSNSAPVKIPFVWIHDVAEGSPAEQDGFKIGDAIY